MTEKMRRSHERQLACAGLGDCRNVGWGLSDSSLYVWASYFCL